MSTRVTAIAQEVVSLRDRLLLLVQDTAVEGLITHDQHIRLAEQIESCLRPLTQLSEFAGEEPVQRSSRCDDNAVSAVAPLLSTADADDLESAPSSLYYSEADGSDGDVLTGLDPSDTESLNRIISYFLATYSPESNPETLAIEKALLRNRALCVRILHAPVGESAAAAAGFEFVPRHAMRARLKEPERERLDRIGIGVASSLGIILLELSPRILIKNEIVHTGRAIVS